MTNSRDSLRAGAEYVTGRMNEILAGYGFQVATEEIMPLSDELPVPRVDGYEIAWVYGVPPWMFDPYYNTRGYRLRWRLRWLEKMFRRVRRGWLRFRRDR